ncbi:response regulator [Kitasatospora griseola]|uniref:hypothetical protein n=1 Tax=Kitasatospora griseola TaxID=2064 RepID=UPI0037F2902A
MGGRRLRVDPRTVDTVLAVVLATVTVVYSWEAYRARYRYADAVEPKPKVVMLTVFDLDQYVHAALKAGASGFLLKDTPPNGCSPPSS